MATSIAALKLPKVLQSHTRDLEKALAVPVPFTWNDDDSFIHAEQPEAIGHVLVRAIHSHLGNRRIGYLFREKMAEREKTVLAKASKVSGKLEYFSELEFVVEVNWKAWDFLQPEQRIAIIDHELCHFGIDGDDHDPVLLPHDLEEFSAIVQRWGVWRFDVDQFAKALKKGPQLGLFDSGKEG